MTVYLYKCIIVLHVCYELYRRKGCNAKYIGRYTMISTCLPNKGLSTSWAGDFFGFHTYVHLELCEYY